MRTFLRLLLGLTLILACVVRADDNAGADLLNTELNPRDLPLISAQIDNDILTVIYNIPDGQHQVIQEDFHFMTVDVDSVPGFYFGETVYPEGGKDEEGNTVYHGIVVLSKPILENGTNPEPPDSVTIEAGYQFCTSDGTCLAPASERIAVPFRRMAGVPPQASGSGKLATVLLNLIFAFLGGLILNVMPCVLPVLSIKIMGIVKSAQQNRREIFMGSLTYTAGVLVSFLILGGFVAGLKIAGQSVGWGFQFQNIGFVVFLITIIWIFGLALFDLFIIQLPGAQTATKASAKGGHWGSFMTGIFAVLLATPCTAPMLGAALGWAFSQAPVMIIGSFLIIGMGLAFPFILIGIFPVFVKWIPKPGAWMNTFKEIMAFLLMATVVYLLRVAYFLIEGKVIQIIWFMLAVAFACWIFGKYASPQRKPKMRIAAVIFSLALGLAAGIAFLKFDTGHASEGSLEGVNTTMQRDPHHPDWLVFNPELLESLIRENKPVFIDFAAEWCLTCKTNEAAVLFTEEIQNAFSERNVTLLRGDYTKKNPLIHEWLQKFNRAGVPLYIFYLPGQPAPHVLPEVITREMILDQLAKIEHAERPTQ
ncbi:thioredoxin family protein [bacterium]|nr:thioredoxin family protein [bacterium]